MGGCPDNDSFVGFIERRLDAGAMGRFEEHLDDCDACRRVLALMGSALDAPPAADSAPAEEPPLATEMLLPGTRLGRYVVLRRLGRGGLGVVYAAYDPELDRNVAVKLLRPATVVGRDDNARLRREAQAMAKVTHPNVVAVHDAGMFAGCAFVAMEQVAGVTLAEWLRARPTPSAIIALFRDAAAGLSAVHDAGLVHRDFKPDNVLVGDDGRVRVSDFGLARVFSLGEESSNGEEPVRELTATRRDASGRIVGTPPYMAPEQHAGGAVDARVDQFAFCVALWEALFEEPPFRRDSEEDMVADKRRGPPGAPRRRGVSSRVRAALVRGLDPDPARRFPSMHALAAAIAPPARWRLAALGVGAVMVALGAASFWPHTSDSAPSCAEGRSQLAGVWDEQRADAVRAAFAKTGASYAHQAFTVVGASLDRYADDWAQARTDACRLALRPDDPAHAMAALRSACLDGLRRDLEALVSVLADADARTAERAVTLVQSLAPIDSCSDDAALMRRVLPPEGAEQRARVAELRAVVAKSEALREAGRHDDALASVEAIEKDVAGTGYEPLRAEWLLAHAAALQAKVSGTRTEAALIETLRAAESARHDRVVAEAWLRYTRWLAWQGRELERAETAAALTDGAIARMGGDERLEDGLALIVSFTLMGRGKYDQGLKDLRALEARQRDRLGDRALELVPTLEERWRASLLLGRYREAHEAALAAMSIGRESFAPSHPRMGDLLHMRGSAELRLGKLDEADATLHESLRVHEANFGKAHTRLDFVLGDLARLHSRRGQHEQAIQFARRAVAINEKTFTRDAPPTAFAEIPLAEVLFYAGQAKEAREVAAHSAAVFRAALGPEHVLLLDVEALAAVAQAEENPATARETLERVRRAQDERGATPERRAEVLFALAQALGHADDRALAFATEAVRLLADFGEAWKHQRDEIEAWRPN
jgi:tetratricopeptide (TPR) repeat protein